MLRRSVGFAVAAGALSAVSALALAAPVAASGDGGRGGSKGGGSEIEIHDDCQPASFNAAFGAGVCVGEGRTTVTAFFAELAATKAAAAWNFDPSMLTIRGGRPVILENEGGETHTFTMVKMVGGGFIAPLNIASNNPVPAPECATTLADGKTLVPTPASPVNVLVAADKEVAFKTAGLKPGKYLFECCIHPWMRVVLTVR